MLAAFLLIPKAYAAGAAAVTAPYIRPVGIPSVSHLTPTQVIAAIFSNLFNIMTLLAGCLAVIYIAWAGIQYITAGGSADKAKTARAAIINGIIGVIIVVSTFFIVRIAVSLGRTAASLTTPGAVSVNSTSSGGSSAGGSTSSGTTASSSSAGDGSVPQFDCQSSLSMCDSADYIPDPNNPGNLAPAYQIYNDFCLDSDVLTQHKCADGSACPISCAGPGSTYLADHANDPVASSSSSGSTSSSGTSGSGASSSGSSSNGGSGLGFPSLDGLGTGGIIGLASGTVGTGDSGSIWFPTSSNDTTTGTNTGTSGTSPVTATGGVTGSTTGAPSLSTGGTGTDTTPTCYLGNNGSLYTDQSCQQPDTQGVCRLTTTTPPCLNTVLGTTSGSATSGSSGGGCYNNPLDGQLYGNADCTGTPSADCSIFSAPICHPAGQSTSSGSGSDTTGGTPGSQYTCYADPNDPSVYYGERDSSGLCNTNTMLSGTSLDFCNPIQSCQIISAVGSSSDSSSSDSSGSSSGSTDSSGSSTGSSSTDSSAGGSSDSTGPSQVGDSAPPSDGGSSCIWGASGGCL